MLGIHYLLGKSASKVLDLCFTILPNPGPVPSLSPLMMRGVTGPGFGIIYMVLNFRLFSPGTKSP